MENFEIWYAFTEDIELERMCKGLLTAKAKGCNGSSFTSLLFYVRVIPIYYWNICWPVLWYVMLFPSWIRNALCICYVWFNSLRREIVRLWMCSQAFWLMISKWEWDSLVLQRSWFSSPPKKLLNCVYF